ncbi:DUF1800 domain-containing protein [Runella salmonicolor]|uniref:DUF1800 domain-containing protein n=1 Tax=Runella salmonicolor TaxID=2950278 RepID=A0ABT1FPX4_9BACT|nr:DUF1800 domain-containing protein [Runella salmonicolor]MCP1383804.1 DUF1800 domain-containing protein [Runella salmonicolor]
MPVWDISNAKHLLSRCLFGYSRKDLEQALSYPTLEEFVEKSLLASLPLPPPPGDWVNENPVANNGTADGDRYRSMTYWWYNQQLGEKLNMREKMVLFWHNHFVSERDKVNFPQHMYRQNTLFRRSAWGNFRQLTKEVTIDPAMLIYLDGRLSSGNTPNENYARELMELFTLGIGNYTETDVKQAALALTGWQVNGLNATFNPNRFSNTTKTFLGKTGNFAYGDIVDIILEKPQAAEFICQKLYKEFIFYKPNETFVKQMADVFRKNNYEIRPVLSFMLTSDEFYKTDYKGAKIKSPMETTIGILKAFDMTPAQMNPTADWAYVYTQSQALQQQLFFPPSVQGWVGQRDWINSTTFVVRGGFSDNVVNMMGNARAVQFKNISAPVDYARSYKTSEDAVKFVDDVVTLFLQFPLSAQKKDALVRTLLGGTILANWSTSTPGADVQLKVFFKAVMRLPEFQLA